MTNSKQFDSFQIKSLTDLLDAPLRALFPAGTRYCLNPDNGPQLIKQAYELFVANLHSNPYFKRTPKCFHGREVFLLQLWNAIQQHPVAPRLSLKQWEEWLYSQYVLTSLSGCPDVEIASVFRLIRARMQPQQS